MFYRMRNPACSFSTGLRRVKGSKFHRSKGCPRLYPLCIYGIVVLFLLAGSICSSQASSDLILGWDPNPEPDISGYVLYSGERSQSYNQRIALGNVTETIVGNLLPGTTYFFSIAAINSFGLEGDLSDELSYLVPPSGPPQPRLLSISSPAPRKVTVRWVSVPGSTYRVAGKTTLADATWADLSQNITATTSITSWTGTLASGTTSKFFVIRLITN